MARALSDVAPSRFELGRTAAREGRFAHALQAFEIAADEGVADAYFELGMLYADGRGVPRSLEKACALFALGAEAGSPNAQYAHALALLPHDRADAERWLLSAAEAGHAPAMTRLAELVRERDPVAARALWARAAQAGRPEAMSAYGNALALGTGGEVDPMEGLAWLYAAASLSSEGARDVLKLARVLKAKDIAAAQRRGRALAKRFRKRA